MRLTLFKYEILMKGNVNGNAEWLSTLHSHQSKYTRCENLMTLTERYDVGGSRKS